MKTLAEQSSYSVPQTPLTIEGYADFMVRQAQRKGWTNNSQWLQNSIFKETVELIKAIEANESDDKIGGEASDILYFLWQYVKLERQNINLDQAMLAKMQDNEIKKKKTLDTNGNIVKK